jgi:hypothetical protein
LLISIRGVIALISYLLSILLFSFEILPKFVHRGNMAASNDLASLAVWGIFVGKQLWQ